MILQNPTNSLDELLADASRAQPPGLNRPWVTLAFAQSLDGSLAARTGSPLALSGGSSLALTHRLRASHQGILVGINTLLADNPRLTVRLAPGESPQPVVLDGRLRTPLNSHLMQHPIKPWIFCGEQAESQHMRRLVEAGARILPVAVDGNGQLSLADVLHRLSEFGLSSLMVEGGAGVLSSFLRLRLADCAVITLAPIWVGGLHLTEIAPSQVEQGNFPRLEHTGSAWFGNDLVIWGKLV